MCDSLTYWRFRRRRSTGRTGRAGKEMEVVSQWYNLHASWGQNVAALAIEKDTEAQTGWVPGARSQGSLVEQPRCDPIFYKYKFSESISWLILGLRRRALTKQGKLEVEQPKDSFILFFKYLPNKNWCFIWTNWPFVWYTKVFIHSFIQTS